MTSFDEVVRFQPGDDGTATVHLGRELHGAFGGAFGGLVSACAVRAARRVAPGTVPAAVDARFLRGVPAGAVPLRATVLRAGRTLSTVTVEVSDNRGRLCATVLVGLVSPESLEPVELAHPDPPRVPAGPGRPWTAPEGVEIPILETLAPRLMTTPEGASVVTLTVPWDDSPAEAVCAAADLSTGPPVAAALAAAGRGWIPHPNPDLSLRLAGVPDRVDPVAVSVAGPLAGGVALVTLTVLADGRPVAAGVASSLLLSGGGRGG